MSQRRYVRGDYTQGPRGIRAVHYDRLREAGVPRERALEVASRATEKQQRDNDRNAGGNVVSAPIRQRDEATANPFRVPFDWERTD